MRPFEKGLLLRSGSLHGYKQVSAACFPVSIQPLLCGSHMHTWLVFLSVYINKFHLERGERCPLRPNDASSLAGGVKGDVSLLLGDQSWSGKISGPKPARENLPARLYLLLSLKLSALSSVRLLKNCERKDGAQSVGWSTGWTAHYWERLTRTWWCLSVWQWPRRAAAVVKAATARF